MPLTLRSRVRPTASGERPVATVAVLDLGRLGVGQTGVLGGLSVSKLGVDDLMRYFPVLLVEVVLVSLEHHSNI